MTRRPARPPTGTTSSPVRNVCAAYGPYRALFDVSFRVPEGGVVALVGSNGAGQVDHCPHRHRTGDGDPGSGDLLRART